MNNFEKIPVGVIGATGIVGQRFITLLDGHPWFCVAAVGASKNSEGLVYKDACICPNKNKWNISKKILNLKVVRCEPQAFINAGCYIIFSALPHNPLESIELQFAKAGFFVFSNSKTHRLDIDCPILMPYINLKQLEIIKSQKTYMNGAGAIITNANCSCTGLAVVLHPLFEALHFERIYVATVQAISGVGYPGLSAFDIQDNVIPYIEEEEDKIEREIKKMLGELLLHNTDGNLCIAPAKLEVLAMCHRACLTDGHIVTVIIDLPSALGAVSKDEILETARNVLKSWRPPEDLWNLPSCPKEVLHIDDNIYRPQPRFDCERGNGMTVSVGPIQPKYNSKGCLVSLKLTTLVHNTILGAAGCSILNAEATLKKGLIRTPFGDVRLNCNFENLKFELREMSTSSK